MLISTRNIQLEKATKLSLSLLKWTCKVQYNLTCVWAFYI